jgi:putative chitinase
MITETQLRGIMPRVQRADLWLAPLNEATERFAINSPERVAAFLAQIAHESGELNRLTENLNYSAERLMAIWPKRFPDPGKAREYERNPEKLANFVYANRLGNGDVPSGDGWRYRGRGLIQVTGRGNYRSASRALGLDFEQRPELLEEPGPAALSAAWFWSSRGLNELADDRSDDDDDEDFVLISVTINGGKAGLAERRRYWQAAKAVLAAGNAAAAQAARPTAA